MILRRLELYRIWQEFCLPSAKPWLDEEESIRFRCPYDRKKIWQAGPSMDRRLGEVLERRL